MMEDLDGILVASEQQGQQRTVPCHAGKHKGARSATGTHSRQHQRQDHHEYRLLMHVVPRHEAAAAPYTLELCLPIGPSS